MSRYSDWDDEEPYPNAWALWAQAGRNALKGKRGRQALTDLRDALLALPEKRLIASALCTVGSEQRREEEPGDWSRQDFARLVAQQGEGVCAVGAYLWWRKVKAGTDPAEAFAQLPTLPDYDGADLNATADLAASEAGMAFSLAWQLAFHNDETYRDCTPEQRYEKFLAWLDAELAEAAA